MEHLIPKIESYFYGEKRKGHELTPKLCPFCNGGTHGDKETFSFNVEQGTYNCLRGSCGEKGNALTLARHLGIDTTDYTKVDYKREKPKEKTYVKPEYIHNDLTKVIVDYFKLRGISQETLIKNKVTSDASGNIQFNYYENGELVFVKYKIPRKPKIVGGKKERKAWRDAGTKPILYGMDGCDIDLPLIIIEGEPDKLVLDECGIPNCVSIPSGTNDLSWIATCWDFLESFSEIILWGDNDKAGTKFVQDAITRLDAWKLKVVECEAKDANVLLFNSGQIAVMDAIASAKVIGKDYITDMADVQRVTYDADDAVGFGIEGLDKSLGGAFKGQLIVWTGYNGSGKSTLLSNIILNGVDKKNTFIYSGELSKGEVKEWMDMQLLGRKYLDTYYSPIKQTNIAIPNERYYDQLDEYYRGRVALYDSDDYANDTDIFNAMEYMVKRENTEVIMLDNLLTIPLTGQGTYDEKVTRTVIKLKKFCRKYRVIIHLVAHPKKPQFGQSRVNRYDIAGTSNISNLCDVVIGVHRVTKEEKKQEDGAYDDFDTLALLLKGRKFGALDDEIGLGFEYYSKRYYTTAQEKNKEYSWVKNIPEEETWEKVEDEDAPF